MKSLILFLLSVFVLLSQEMPPPPPVFPIERVLSQPIPDYALLSPKASQGTNDKAMVSVLWDYSTPEGYLPGPVPLVVFQPLTTDLHIRRVASTHPLVSVCSADRPVYVINNTNIVVPSCGAMLKHVVLCPDGVEITWQNVGTNEIEWSTNLTFWVSTNIRWEGEQVVSYYINPSNYPTYYRKVPR